MMSGLGGSSGGQVSNTGNSGLRRSQHHHHQLNHHSHHHRHHHHLHHHHHQPYPNPNVILLFNGSRWQLQWTAPVALVPWSWPLSVSWPGEPIFGIFPTFSFYHFFRCWCCCFIPCIDSLMVLSKKSILKEHLVQIGLKFWDIWVNTKRIPPWVHSTPQIEQSRIFLDEYLQPTCFQCIPSGYAHISSYGLWKIEVLGPQLLLIDSWIWKHEMSGFNLLNN